MAEISRKIDSMEDAQIHQMIINELIDHAEKNPLKSNNTSFVQFVQRYFFNAPAEDLTARSIVDLYGCALSHWQLLQGVHKGESKIKVFNPNHKDDGWQSSHTIVQVIIGDTPFLVDSIQMLLSRLGFMTHLMIHSGGMEVFRDKSGHIIDVHTSIHNQDSNDQHLVAPICMEIDKQTSVEVLEKIKYELSRVLTDVEQAVEDWDAMKNQVYDLIDKLEHDHYPQGSKHVVEIRAFLEWLLENFTFLGCRDYRVVGRGTKKALQLVPETCMGVLRDHKGSKLFRQYSDLPMAARELALSKDDIMVICKTNTISTVHRPAYTDCVIIKIFNEDGGIVGERRFIGLYTSRAYSSDPRIIPYIREKVAYVLNKSGFSRNSHSGKDLIHILSNIPRDDLFHATSEELLNMSLNILHIQERKQIRLFLRHDAYGRYISCLVYVPRDNFNTELLLRMQHILTKAMHGESVQFSTYFSDSILARIHYVIRVDPQRQLQINSKVLEQQLTEVGQSWYDSLKEKLIDTYGEEQGNVLSGLYIRSFPAGYRESFKARDAVMDIGFMQNLAHDNLLEMSFYNPLGDNKSTLRLKLYCADHTIPLSDALPMLENLGLRVIAEEPYEIILSTGQSYWINDFVLVYSSHSVFDIKDIHKTFKNAFRAIWLGDSENDSFNKLVLGAYLSWREIALFRAYAKYLRQIGFSLSMEYMAQTLVTYPEITRLLFEMFEKRFHPEKFVDDPQEIQVIDDLLKKKLEEVVALDDDRIVQMYAALINATVRTNFYQLDLNDTHKTTIALKFAPENVPQLPAPVPKYEIFVYSSRFEGVHLRMDAVARGGIRWSDRIEDYRTEDKGLMMAQNMKNAGIVPAGAKGCFITKKLPAEGGREAIYEEGHRCYKKFISGMLDVVDDLHGEEVNHPLNTICYDEQDTYLVVAADKGTATFSDTANAIAIDRGFWLGDAFASGGQTGYDHKKMGITARGTWVSAENHFREMGINLEYAEITVVAIGDMSGDVFGNGMLLSKHLRLVAAFNHQHIFIDPDPDSSDSYKERKRLFEMPRSSWDNYNRDILSAGGGIYSRNAKAIRISAQVQALLNLTKNVVQPNELIQAVLQTPVDLLWNGGVGTFIKSSAELDIDVGDRSNTALRVNANQVQAKVICEGGNLGMTQLARIEYELNGGRVNTDFIDNSAGVDCSDREVNIKILLNSIVEQGDLTYKQRNLLLANLTEEVANLVLADNYRQNLVLSMATLQAPEYMNLYMRYMDYLQSRNLIDRQLFHLPDQDLCLERKALDKGLTRPELAILYATTKNILKDEVIRSDIINDDFLSQYIEDAFPESLFARYSHYMLQHKLRHEIISTQISSRLVSDMGIIFVYQMVEETGADLAHICRAYVVSSQIFHLNHWIQMINQLDFKVSPEVKYELLLNFSGLVRRSSRWMLRKYRDLMDCQSLINKFSNTINKVQEKLSKIIMGELKDSLEEQKKELLEEHVPEGIAQQVASLGSLYHLLNIAEVAFQYDKIDILKISKFYFTLMDRLDLYWFRKQIDTYPIDTKWAILARSGFKSDLDNLQCHLLSAVLAFVSDKQNIPDIVDDWLVLRKSSVDRWNSILSQMRGTDSKDSDIVVVAIRELSLMIEDTFK